MYPPNIQQEYEKWANAHKRMKKSPPGAGRDYLKHAINLLSMLEPFAELHPIAKVVVGSFKQVILFEQDRQENDARVVAVVLAQTDMMAVLLDIDDLTNRRGNSVLLKTVAALPELFDEIRDQMRECHNSIDTYYKEHYLAKFCKAKDWKDRMLHFVDAFDKYRLRIQQILSFEVAAGVDDLVSKMDIVLSRFFAPYRPWELAIASKMQSLENVSGWMNDSENIRSLAVAAGDPSFGPEGNEAGMMEKTEAAMQLDKLKEDLQISLNILCERNLDRFDLKLKLYAERLEKAIAHSAGLIIRTLSGPHDRLDHEDLRQLWKDMKWMFCVETRTFSVALFEYYLDKYSTPHDQTETDPGSVGHDNTTISGVDCIMNSNSRLLTHPQAWTLEYISQYSEIISIYIDSDHSGFVRISEANAFTASIPEGWTLSEWCAFLVAGQFYEHRIYRKRITHLRHKINEMHAQILPENRAAAARIPRWIFHKIIHYMSLEPIGDYLYTQPPPALQLRDLVKNKIIAQDAKLRTRLNSLKWSIEDYSTIDLLSEGKALEIYILPLCCVMMEFLLDVHHLCCSVTLDLKEWMTINEYYTLLRDISMRRIDHLTGTLGVHDLFQYHWGIWWFLSRTKDAKMYGVFSLDYDISLAPVFIGHIIDYYSDIEVLEEFPLPTLTGSLLSRKYNTWEEFVQTRMDSDIPSTKPLTWNPIEDTINDSLIAWKNHWSDLPLQGWSCQRCKKVSAGNERRFQCAECPDFDLCIGCYELPVADHVIGIHNFEHSVIFATNRLQSIRYIWAGFRAGAAIGSLRKKFLDGPVTPSVEAQLPQIPTKLESHRRRTQTGVAEQEEYRIHSSQFESFVQRPENYDISYYQATEIPHLGHLPIQDQLGIEVKDDDLKCGRCSAKIIVDSKFYLCLEYSCTVACPDFYLCDKCVDERDNIDGSNHLWWHSLLQFDERNLHINERKESPALDAEAEQAEDGDKPEDKDNCSEPPLDDRLVRLVSKVEERISGLESMVDERIAVLELKMDNLFTEVRKGLSALVPAQT